MKAASSIETYLARFEAQKGTRSGEPEWIARSRREAIERFAKSGFPTTADEEWRYTSVEPIAHGSFRFATPLSSSGGDLRSPPDPLLTRTGKAGCSLAGGLSPEHVEELTFPGFKGIRLVFVNGFYSEKLSEATLLPPGIRVERLGSLEEGPTRIAPAGHPFADLNGALWQDGVAVSVERGTTLIEPIELIFFSRGDAGPVVSFPRVTLRLGEGSEAQVIESHAGEGHYFSCGVTEILQGPASRLDHVKFVRESAQGLHVGVVQARQTGESWFHSTSITDGGALVRNDIGVTLEAEGAECRLDGLYLTRGRDHVDHHTTIDHLKPHGTSAELYKGILDDASRGVFNGRIVVRPGAQKTVARQTNKNLLLSKDADVNTKPLLEIFANDVKCNHGATIGRLDENQLFYLRSRGIGMPEARGLLLYAFAADIIEKVRSIPLRRALELAVFERFALGRRGDAGD